MDCVEINGRMLADVSGEEVEDYLLANGLVERTDREAGAPANRCGYNWSPQQSSLQSDSS